MTRFCEKFPIWPSCEFLAPHVWTNWPDTHDALYGSYVDS